ncbi:intermediate filament protein ifa-1-like [Octopus sinensis]|uniref:Intermediate filament protein ifa-1-like n=1 Tax=Octopus sinensis TaxID=2607531 RepID=A0A6P7TWM9_9MOLL|nr:intermediate filament protein ifa-1-like [Octopus sinensis]
MDQYIPRVSSRNNRFRTNVFTGHIQPNQKKSQKSKFSSELEHINAWQKIEDKLDEKTQFKDLNTKLAALIETTRYNEAEYHELIDELEIFKKYLNIEASNVRNMYECEIEQIQKMLDLSEKQKFIEDIDPFVQLNEERNTRFNLQNHVNDLREQLEYMIAVQNMNNILKYQIHSIKNEIQDCNESSKEMIANKNEEIQQLRNLFEDILAQMELINDNNISIKSEIDVYRKLLGDETEQILPSVPISLKCRLGIVRS